MKNKFSITLKAADYVTLLNAISGLMAIFFIMYERYEIALILILVALIFDFLDGKVARATSSSKIGGDLDSLADTISFGVAPAVLLMSLLPTVTGVIFAILFACCGILRLARFNAIPVKGGYEGVPIPLPSIAIAIYYFAGLPIEYLPYLYLLFAALMISSIKVKKFV